MYPPWPKLCQSLHKVCFRNWSNILKLGKMNVKHLADMGRECKNKQGRSTSTFPKTTHNFLNLTPDQRLRSVGSSGPGPHYKIHDFCLHP